MFARAKEECISAHATVRLDRHMWLRQYVLIGTCGCQRGSFLALLLRISVCERSAKHVSLHAADSPPLSITHVAFGTKCVSYFLFGSFRLALNPPVQVRKFPNEIEDSVSDYML